MADNFHSPVVLTGTSKVQDLGAIEGFPATVPTITIVTGDATFPIAPFADLGSVVFRVQRIVFGMDSSGASNVITITDGTNTATLATASSASDTVRGEITLIGCGYNNRLYTMVNTNTSATTYDLEHFTTTAIDLSAPTLKIGITNVTNAGAFFAAHYLMDNN